MLAKHEVIAKADKLNCMAAKLLPLPDGLTQPEQLLYKSLCLLYREYRNNQITAEQAKKEKQKLYSAYLDSAYDLDLWHTYGEICKIYQKKQYEIHKSGCKVCQSLNNLLCGLEAVPDEEVHQCQTME